MNDNNSNHNLIPELDSERWECRSPRETLAPQFERRKVNGEPVLIIGTNGKFENYGKWVCTVPDIQGGATYWFSIKYHAQSVSYENVSIYVMLTWKAESGIRISRDYADNILKGKDGWNELYRVIDVPAEALILEVELAFRWSDNGSVSWKKPSLTKAKPVIHRKIKVATTLITKFHNNLYDNLSSILNTIDKAGKEKPDIICLSEAVYSGNVNLPLIEKSESIPGRLTNAVSEKARIYGTHIIVDLLEKEGEHIYNTAVLIGRNGQIIGKYRKTHLPLSEAEWGVEPGNDYPVFDTDFGRIGIMICWDHWFPEVARILRIKGAEVLFVSTMGNAYIQSIARAVDNGVHVVVAGNHGSMPSRIINPEGKIIGEIADEHQGVCVAEIDLDKRYYTPWLSVGTDGEAHSIFLKERRTDTYNILVND